jgi:hypothetical protein
MKLVTPQLEQGRFSVRRWVLAAPRHQLSNTITDVRQRLNPSTKSFKELQSSLSQLKVENA